MQDCMQRGSKKGNQKKKRTLLDTCVYNAASVCSVVTGCSLRGVQPQEP
jgi:hypothetical protein